MSYLPIEHLEQLRIGTVEFVSPSEIKVSLEIDAPDSVSLQGGIPRSFPRINSYVLINNDDGYLVGQVEWIAIERSAYPKRKGLHDFGLIDLPFPIRKLCLNPVGTLKNTCEGFDFTRGTDAFPSVGDSVLLPTDNQLRSIIESGENRKVKIGESPLANNAEISIDPNKLFGRHVAVLGNTGSGKSCSVAGLIQWSIDAVLKANSSVNARFIVLDPNGEYSQALGPKSKYKGKLIKVEARHNERESSLKIPAWLWNSSEWAAFTQASSKVQLPLVRQALRAMRNNQQTSESSTKDQARHYCGLILLALEQTISKGKIFTDPGPVKGFFEDLSSWHSNLQYLLQQTQESCLNILINDIRTLIDTRAGQQWPKKPTIQETHNLTSSINICFVSLGGHKSDLLPKNEDIPIRFINNDFINYIEMLAKETGTEQFVEFLLSRIRTMLGDTRINAITDDSDKPIELIDFLESYLGNNTDTAITIIDLSLVPNDIVHLVTAVISRIIFEALQRYRKITGNTLPTVLVAEEAHNFIKRYKDNNEEQNISDVCCKVFEKIAKEGRKFGLGLVISSQRPSELSSTVLSQCNTFLLHRISNDRDQEQVHKLLPDNMRGLLRELPTLPSRHAILLGWASELPVLVRMTELDKENRPKSDDPDFWNAWASSEESNNRWEEIVQDWQQN
ncbi:ATPase [Acinetobacter lactucae]|uniref:ATP-binding protein n=1 Tax=Acinetobacter calcoaceticus/baumannii complex TaxID=909768 RepID=UPI0007A00285|nr:MULTISPECIES: DUF87 domain-containing protein [Acinetobacter calcoaceticus/baumannii complex]KYQ79718.1 ATPase [Acinetobacter lactucae]MCU4548649.1 DUF87 domain-containing protein [Acinetobacter pittii]MZY05512.1 DUF87 domain-containing protein [Acinetobacter pittii]OCY34139.1 ATPase [Acinetobacter pittii]